MEVKRIDFIGVIVVDGANPNGDPLGGNRPRTNSDGRGFISPECIKRKIRNRMQEMGEEIFVQTNNNIRDGFDNLQDRYRAYIYSHPFSKKTPEDERRSILMLSEKWFDVRAFGQVFPFKGTQKDDISFSVRGPVSITAATSLDVVEIQDRWITKSANAEEFSVRDSSTMGRKWRTWGAYVFSGGIYPQLAEKTGFSQEDAEKIKQCILTMFVGDATAARPIGSMELGTLLWYTHRSRSGNVSPMRLSKSIRIEPRKEWPYYEIVGREDFPGVETEIYEMGGHENDR